jgi:hypothetical protein
MDRLNGKLPRYGALARRSLDEMIAGASVDVAPYKRDPMDFVLWKPSRPKTSRAGRRRPASTTPGRPGWHIECSAMSMAKLLRLRRRAHLRRSAKNTSTSMAAASISSSRTTRTRSRSPAAPSTLRAHGQYLDA